MHAVLHYYYLGPSVQKTKPAQATFSRVSWYEENIKLLQLDCSSVTKWDYFITFAVEVRF